MTRGHRHTPTEEFSLSGEQLEASSGTTKKPFLGRLILWLGVGSLLTAGLLFGVWGGWWVYSHIVISIAITDQPIGVMLPKTFQASAEVTNDLDVVMQGEIETSVPFNQALTVPFKGRYDFDVEMQAQVPVEFEVAYDGILPVDTSANITIRTGINYKNLKALRNLEIQTSLPLKFSLPVKLKIPVKDVIELTYSGPLSADINQNVETRVDTVLRTKLPVNQTITTPVTAALPLTVYPDDDQVRLLLSTMLIELQPARMLSFSLADDTDGPFRSKNPWGPLDPSEH